MLFKPELCQAILDGRKGQTRRLVKDREVAIHKPPGYTELPIEAVFSGGICGRLKWQVGRTYAIQPARGKKAVGRFLLAGIRRERLQDMSEEDARREALPEYNGMFETWRDCFRVLWNEIHTEQGTRFEDGPEVWVLELEVVNASER